MLFFFWCSAGCAPARAMHESDRRGDGDDDQDGRPWRDPTSFSILWFYFILFYFIPLIVKVTGYVYRKDWAGAMRWHRVDRRRHRRMAPLPPGSTCRLAPGRPPPCVPACFSWALKTARPSSGPRGMGRFR
jgi:hypothetical protein